MLESEGYYRLYSRKTTYEFSLMNLRVLTENMELITCKILMNNRDKWVLLMTCANFWTVLSVGVESSSSWWTFLRVLNCETCIFWYETISIVSHTGNEMKGTTGQLLCNCSLYKVVRFVSCLIVHSWLLCSGGRFTSCYPLRQGFSTWALWTFWTWKFFVMEDCPVFA